MIRKDGCMANCADCLLKIEKGHFLPEFSSDRKVKCDLCEKVIKEKEGCYYYERCKLLYCANCKDKKI